MLLRNSIIHYANNYPDSDYNQTQEQAGVVLISSLSAVQNDTGYGVFYIGGAKRASISVAEFNYNKARFSGAALGIYRTNLVMNDVSAVGNDAVSGGFAYIKDSDVTLERGKFDSHFVDSAGAVFYLAGKTTFDASDVIMSGGTAYKRGGAIYVEKGSTLGISSLSLYE